MVLVPACGAWSNSLDDRRCVWPPSQIRHAARKPAWVVDCKIPDELCSLVWARPTAGSDRGKRDLTFFVRLH